MLDGLDVVLLDSRNDVSRRNVAPDCNTEIFEATGAF
jgi:hypothetical protein